VGVLNAWQDPFSLLIIPVFDIQGALRNKTVLTLYMRELKEEKLVNLVYP
jgi:hypothetical protein